MAVLSRRELVQQFSLAALSGSPAVTIGLGFGTYGMRSMKTSDALRAIAAIGYDAVELALLPGWPAEATLLSPADRAEIRTMLRDLGLALPALLESLPLIGSAAKRAENLERIRQAAGLAHDLSASNPPVLDTILGLKTSDWEQVKGRMADELKDWAKVAEASDFTICFKPHADQAVHDPKRALWLIREVGSARIRVVYDYSHFYLEGLALADSLKELLPVAPFISVKDSTVSAGKHEYLLPGEGKTDYVEYLTLLKKLRYGGYICVEVSAQIHGKPGYEPLPTAKLCYERLAPAFIKAGVQRPGRRI